MALRELIRALHLMMTLDVRSPPHSVLVSRSHDPPGSSGQHHTVVNQAQNFDNLVRSEPVDNEVTRTANPPGGLSTPTQESDWVGENTWQMGNLDRSDHTWIVAEGGHDRQDQLPISSSGFQAVVTCAVE